MSPGTDAKLGVTILLICVAMLFANYWNNWPVDLSAIYFASHFYELGMYDLVYAPDGNLFWVEPPDEWRQLAITQGEPEALVPAFVYPPIWAALLGPVTQWISFTSFANIVLVISIASLLGMIFLSFQLSRRIANETSGKYLPFWIWAVICSYIIGFSSIGALSLQLLQPQIFVSFLLLWMIFALTIGQNTLAGGLLAVAAAVKLMPALLVILLVIERRWRALISFIAIGGALGLLSVLLAGWPMHQALLDRISSLNSEILVSRLNFSVELVVYHLGLIFEGSAPWRIDTSIMVDQAGWIALVSRAVLIIGLLTVWFAPSRLPDTTRLWFRFMILYLVVVIASPLAWLHYLLLPGIMLPGLLSMRNGMRFRAIFVIIAIATSLPVFLKLVDVSWAGYVQVYLHFSVVAVILWMLATLARQSQN